MLIKPILSFLYTKSGLLNLYRKYIYKNKYLILMYHRVIPLKEATPILQAGMYVEPETFDMHLYYLKKHFRIIPFNELIFCLNDKSYNKCHKPICILTFDDGWYDFYKYAYPILTSQKVPATVFLPTKYIGTESRFWTDQLANLLLQKNIIKKRYFNMKNTETEHLEVIENIDRINGTIDFQIEQAISILKKYSDEEIHIIIKTMGKKWNGDDISIGRAFLTWEEVREMMESKLIIFGSHTHNHNMLTHLTDRKIINELIQSKEKLLFEKAVKTDFIPFSYPNGNYNEMVANMVIEAGYHVATTTENGWNQQDTSMFRLNRVAIHQDMSLNEEMLGCRICNLI